MLLCGQLDILCFYLVRGDEEEVASLGMVILVTLMRLIGASKHRDATAFYTVRYLAYQFRVILYGPPTNNLLIIGYLFPRLRRDIWDIQ
jgi:hypothetical protein